MHILIFHLKLYFYITTIHLACHPIFIFLCMNKSIKQRICGSFLFNLVISLGKIRRKHNPCDEKNTEVNFFILIDAISCTFILDMVFSPLITVAA